VVRLRQDPHEEQDTFGRLLGERWEAVGDGTYRLIREAEGDERPDPDEAVTDVVDEPEQVRRGTD
jgi:hypothetical protein